MYRDIPQELRALIEPVVESHGLELVDVELNPGQSNSTLSVTVDTPQNDGRVVVDQCALVSRELESHLDAADPIPNRYRLEVSSPGLDRRLSREKDFESARGSVVKIETRHPLDGRRRFRGRLVDFAEGKARLVVDGREVAIPFEEVSRANAVYEFSSEDFRRSA